jgi:hypothetical protein
MDFIVDKVVLILKAGFKICLPRAQQGEMQRAIRKILVENTKLCTVAKVTKRTKRKAHENQDETEDETQNHTKVAPPKRVKRVKSEPANSVGDIIAVRTISDFGSDHEDKNQNEDDKWSLATVMEVQEDSLRVQWLGDPYQGGINCPAKAYRPLICNDMQPWTDTVASMTVLSTLKKEDFFRGKLQHETLLSIRRLL